MSSECLHLPCYCSDSLTVCFNQAPTKAHSLWGTNLLPPLNYRFLPYHFVLFPCTFVTLVALVYLVTTRLQTRLSGSMSCCLGACDAVFLWIQAGLG